MTVLTANRNPSPPASDSSDILSRRVRCLRRDRRMMTISSDIKKSWY